MLPCLQTLLGSWVLSQQNQGFSNKIGDLLENARAGTGSLGLRSLP